MVLIRNGALRRMRPAGFWLGLLVEAIALVAFSGAFSAATSQSYTPPPVHSADDANSVDLISGQYDGAITDAVIGPPAVGGMGHSYIGRYYNGADNYSSDIVVNTSPPTPTAFIFIGNTAEEFTGTSGGGWTSASGSGSILSGTSYGQDAIWNFTTGDGTIYSYKLKSTNAYCNNIYFLKPSVISGIGNYVGELESVTRPNGEILTVKWYENGYSGDVNCVSPLSVSSSRGFSIDYGYIRTIIPGSTQYLGSVTAINSAYYYCDPLQFEGVSTGCYALSPSSSSWVTYTPETSTGTQPDPNHPAVQIVVGDALSRNTATWYNGLIAYPSGMSINYSSSSSGQVTSVSNGTGTWGYNYVTNGATRTTTVTDPLQHQRIVTSDLNLLRVTADQDALGLTTNYNYDSFGRLQQVNYPEGNYTHYTYDARGNVTQTLQVAKPGSGLANITTSASFDSPCAIAVKCNKPNSTTNANNKTTYYTYSTVHGGVLSVVLPRVPNPSYPNGVSPTVAYSYAQIPTYVMNSTNTARVQAGSIWEPTGTTTCAISAATVTATTTSASLTCAAGASDLITTTISYAGSYNALPTSVTVTGANNFSSTTSTTYDNVGNIYTVQGPLGAAQTTRYRFDAARQRVGVVGPDPDGSGPLKNRAVRTTYSPDGLPQLIERGTVPSQSDPDWANFATLAQEAIGYDTIDRPATKSYATTPNGTLTTWSLTQFTYDTANRLMCSAVRMNPAAFGSLPTSACTLGTQGPDGPDRISSYQYFNDNRLQQVTQAVGVAGTTINERTLTYSNNGLVKTIADANGNLTTNQYDGFDRLWQVQYPTSGGGGTSSTTDFEQYAYDNVGHITQDRRRDGEVGVIGYDDLGRLTSLTLPAPSSYSYDNLGRLVLAGRGDQTLGYTYDPINDRTSESGAYGVFNYQYDAAGDLTKITWPDGLYVNYVPGWTGEVTAIEENGATSGVGLLATYGYNDLGQRTSVARGDGVTTAYNYDGAWRLMSLAHSFPSSVGNQTWGLSYNAAGQINSRSSANGAYDWTAAAAPVTYVVNGLNQPTQSGSATLTYGDGRANLTNDSVNVYSYDSANNLIGFNANTTMRSDPAGRLMAVTDSSGGVATTASRWFRYGGAGLLAEYGMTPADNGTLYARYVPGPGPDETVVWYNGSDTSQRRWMMPDERGSVAAVADAGGNLLATNIYDEYGVPGASNLGRMQYTGQMWIPEASLYHFKARDYAPTLGRFLQTDPAGYGDGLNWYIYAHADPLNQIDPSGLDAVTNGDVTTVDEFVVTAAQRGGSGDFDPLAFLWQQVVKGSQIAYNGLRKFASFGPTQGTCEAFNSSGEADCSSGNFLGSKTSQIEFLKYGLGAPAIGVGSGLLIAPGGTLLVSEGVADFSAIGSTGRIGEAALQELGGESQVYFNSNLGGRFVDQFVDGWAYESKVGYQSLTSTNELQIMKDVDLVNSGQIDGATWHFFTSPVTGLGGPSAPLASFPGQNGIGIVVH